MILLQVRIVSKDLLKIKKNKEINKKYLINKQYLLYIQKRL